MTHRRNRITKRRKQQLADIEAEKNKSDWDREKEYWAEKDAYGRAVAQGEIDMFADEDDQDETI